MKYNVKARSAVVYNNYIWFSNDTSNGLYCIDYELMNLKYIGKFPHESIYKHSLHKKVILYMNYLVFLPANSKYIHIFDILKSSFKSILFCEEEPEMDVVADAVCIGNKIYFFSWKPENVLFELDMNLFLLKRIKEFEMQAKQYMSFSKPHFLARCTLFQDKKILFGVLNTDLIAEWDVSSKLLKMNRTGINNIFAVYAIGSNIWVITRNTSDIYCYEMNGSLKKYKSDAVKRSGESGRYYNGVVKYFDKLFAIPAFSDTVVCMKDEFFYSISGDKWEVDYEGVPAFNLSIELQDKLCFMPFSADTIYFFDKAKERITKADSIEIDINSVECSRKLFFEEKTKDSIIIENSTYTLGGFIKYKLL